MNQDAIVTEAGKRLRELMRSRGYRELPARVLDAIAAIEAESAQRALDDVRAKVEALPVSQYPMVKGAAVEALVSRREVLAALQDRGAWHSTDPDAILRKRDRGADREDVSPLDTYANGKDHHR